MGTPTDKYEEERAVVVKFRNRVFDILKSGEDRSDHFLLRWIQAGNYNLEEAERMIRKTFGWRDKYEVDQILYFPVNQFIFENCPYFIDGIDLLGHPVVEIPIGIWDIEKAIDETNTAEFVKYLTYILESIMQKIMASNQDKKLREIRNTRLTAVIDWKGYTYAKLTHWKAVQGILKFAKLLTTHYPEILHKVFYINCPPYFPTLFSLLRSVLSAENVSRISLYGTNSELWKSKISELIHPDQLSTQYGGNRIR